MEEEAEEEAQEEDEGEWEKVKGGVPLVKVGNQVMALHLSVCIVGVH